MSTFIKDPTHKDAYPEQYTHTLVGKTVNVVTSQGRQGSGTVSRVFNTYFGQLAKVEGVGGERDAWSITDCHISSVTQENE